MDLRPVLNIVGILLSTLAASMFLPVAFDLYTQNPDWKVFFLCMVITLFFGGLLVLSTSGGAQKINAKQGFLMISLAWITLSLFSALPFWLSDLSLSLTDSVFEAVSGITTTGATIIVGLESAPKGILIWRAMLQWLGGIGIIIMGVSILPFLKIGGMQLFRVELSEEQKAIPKAAEFAGSVGVIYIFLTLLCTVCYFLSGFNAFDALAHAMTTISTGGYSTKDASFANLDSFWPLIVGIIFMIAGGLPFVLYLKTLRGSRASLLKDSQVRWFLSIIALASFFIIIGMMLTTGEKFNNAFFHSVFNVISVMTGTGYASADYGLWGNFAISIFFFLMAVGACAGSTTCGIKIFRFQVLYAVVVCHIKKLLRPSGVFIPRYNALPIPEGVPVSVMGFFFLYALCFVGLSIGLSMTGLDFMTTVSGAATAISNVGPGLGEIIGPAGNFKPLPDTAKWILILGMILGRLEMFPILVLFSPQFWRR